MSAADLVPLVLQLPGQLTSPVEWPLQMQLVQNPHQPQIPLRQTPCDVVHARTAQIQQLRLALHRNLATPLNHRFPLGPGNFPSAPSKKEFSIVSSPIFACSSRMRSLPSAASTSPPKIPAAFSSSSVFQAATWVAWTSWWAAICATVFSPRIASSATRALNAAEWLRLGFLMDLGPPVAILHRQISTYARVLKTATTSVPPIRDAIDACVANPGCPLNTRDITCPSPRPSLLP